MLPLELEEPVRLEMTEQLNQLLADTMTLSDLYKQSHWQVAGSTFYQLHLLYDKHHDEQVELADRQIANSPLAVPGGSRLRRALRESYVQRHCRRTAQLAASFRDGKPLPW